MTTLFAPHRPSPEAIAANADVVGRRSDALADEVAGAAQAVKDGRSALGGADLPTLVTGLGSRLRDDGLWMREHGAFAQSVLDAWALAVALYDSRVELLNREWELAQVSGFGVPEPKIQRGDPERFEQYADALGTARSAKLADLQRRQGKLEADLDDTANRLASLLDKGPGAETWKGLGDHVGVPPQYAPPPPPAPKAKGDPPWVTALTLAFADPRACVGPDADALDCTLEVAGVLPVGKVLKTRKLGKAVKGIEDLKKARRARRTTERELPGLSPTAPKPLGRGSTGRTTPRNLREQIAMTAVRSNPEGAALRLKLNDPRWPESEGWGKRHQRVNGISIHYVYNRRTGEFDDFKFKEN